MNHPSVMEGMLWMARKFRLLHFKNSLIRLSFLVLSVPDQVSSLC